MTSDTPAGSVPDPSSAAVPRSFTIALAVVLGLGPFAIDMYLASLPEIGETFGAAPWLVQLTLTGYLVLLGVGQLIAGPITDAFGRRAPLLIGIGAFLAACLLASAAPSMAVLVIARMLQGAGAAIAFVVVNSAVRDRAQGQEATRTFAMLMTVSAVVPMIAPALGGIIGEALGWRAVFLALAGIGALALLVALRWLPESLPAERREPLAFAPALSGYGALLRSRRVLLPLSALSAAFVYLFCYLGGASYVYQASYGVGEGEFGILFGLTGVSALLGSLIAHRLADRMSTRGLGILGAGIMLGGSALALLAVATGQSILVLAIALGAGLLGLGACEPAFMAMCMSAVDRGVGAAAGLAGAAQYLLGAATTVLIAWPAESGPAPWICSMLAVAALLGVLALLAGRGERMR